MATEGNSNVLLCPNCDVPLEGPSLFCSEKCSQMAGLLRWWRNCISNGKIEDPYIQDTIRLRLNKVLQGGYPRKERHLTPEQRQFIIDRDEGLCVTCKEPGNEIDHIKGSSPDPSNLQLLCTECHREKTMSDLPPLTETQKAEGKIVQARAESEWPERHCDNPDIWTWIWRWRLQQVRMHFKALNDG